MEPTPNILPAGRFFYAAAHPDLQRTRPMIVFVPEQAILTNGTLDKKKYEEGRWHTINAGANHHAVGSHAFPDLTQPARPTTELMDALGKLLQKSMGTPSKPRLPGKAGLQSTPPLEM